MPADRTNSQPRDAETIVEVMKMASSEGFATDLRSLPGGFVRCAQCDQASAASDFVADRYRRLEGASDAADMMIIVLAACPNCGAGGTLILGYGPNAGEEDADVLAALDLREVPSGPDPAAVSAEQNPQDRLDR